MKKNFSKLLMDANNFILYGGVNINTDLLYGVKTKVVGLTKIQMLLLFSAASVFMPFLITCGTLFMVVIAILCDKNLRCLLIKDKTNLIIYGFSVLLLVVPLCYGRYVSALAGLGFMITLVFFMFAKAVMTLDLYDACMDICCFASVIPFIYGIVQKLVFGIDYRATGGLLNANYYGTICEIIIILAVYRLLTNKKAKHLYVTIIVINIVGIFLCDCQSAWIAVMAGVISLIILSGRKKAGLILLGLSIVLIAVGIVIPGLLPRLDLMPQTFSTRLNIWMTAFKGIKAHPLFGQGTLTYLFINELYGGYKTYHAHSLYLDPILSYGIIGAGLLLSYVVIILKNIRQMSIQSGKREVVAVILAVMFSTCVHGITDITILWVQTGMLLFIVLSGAFIIKNQNLQNLKK